MAILFLSYKQFFGNKFLIENCHFSLFFAEFDFSTTDLLVKKCLYDRDLFGLCKAERGQANEKGIIKNSVFS